MELLGESPFSVSETVKSFYRFEFTRLTDSLEGDAPPDPYSRWCGGVIAALIPVVIGLMVIAKQHTYFIGWRPPRMVEYFGRDAVALGVASLAIGMLMHAHYFWSASNRYYFVAQLLKPVSLLSLIASFGYVVVNQLLFG